MLMTLSDAATKIKWDCHAAHVVGLLLIVALLLVTLLLFVSGIEPCHPLRFVLCLHIGCLRGRQFTTMHTLYQNNFIEPMFCNICVDTVRTK